MKLTQRQHEQIVRDLQAQGETVLASEYNDWIFACTHFPLDGDAREEADLERQEAYMMLRAKERGISPH